MTPADILKTLSDRAASGRPTALVTVTAVTGSAPREIGAKMLVFPDKGIRGTIGGGRLEAQAIEDAASALAEGSSRKASYELEPKALGMYCGGTVEVFIDVFADPLKLVILGGGHVGEKVAALAAFLGLPHRVADDRPEYASPARFPKAAAVLAAPPELALKNLGVDEKTAVVIVTRCHGADLRALVCALSTPAFYIGLIGSRTKTRRLFELCRRRELEPEADPRVHAPIGLDLGGTTPEAIALAVLAEVLKVKNGASGQSRRLAAEPAEAA